MRGLLAILVFLAALAAPARADDARTLPPPIGLGSECGLLLSCPWAGPFAAHLTFGADAWILPDRVSPLLHAGISFSLARWVEAGARMSGLINAGGPYTRAYPLTAWIRLSPFPGRGSLQGAVEVRADTAVTGDGGPVYQDAQFFSVLVGRQTEHTRAYAVGSYVQAAARSYAALETGGGVELRAPSWGIGLYAEALGRMSPSADWTAAATFGLKIWDTNGAVRAGYTRASAPGLAPHAAGLELTVTVSKNWVRRAPPPPPPPPPESFLPSALRQPLLPLLPPLRLPELGASPAPGRSCQTYYRAPCVAAYHLGAGLPLQVFPALEAETRAERGAEVEPFETRAEREAERAERERETETENDPRLTQVERDRLRIRHAEQARERAQRRATGPWWPDEGGPPQTSIGPAHPQGGGVAERPAPPAQSRVAPRPAPPPASPAQQVSGAAIRGGAGPVRQGQAGVVKAIKIVEAKGKEVIGTEVTFDTPSGRRRADVVTRDRKTGQIEAHEVKTGQSRYIPKQRRMDGDLNTPGVGGVPAGDRAKAAGLTPGTPVVIPTTVIRLP